MFASEVRTGVTLGGGGDVRESLWGRVLECWLCSVSPTMCWSPKCVQFLKFV